MSIVMASPIYQTIGLSPTMTATFSTHLHRIGLAPQSNMVAEIRLVPSGIILPETTAIVGDTIQNVLQRAPTRETKASRYGDVDGIVYEIGDVPAEGGVWSVQVELVWRQVMNGEGDVGGEGGVSGATAEEEGVAAWLKTAEEWSRKGGGGGGE